MLEFIRWDWCTCTGFSEATTCPLASRDAIKAEGVCRLVLRGTYLFAF